MFSSATRDMWHLMGGHGAVMGSKTAEGGPRSNGALKRFKWMTRDALRESSGR